MEGEVINNSEIEHDSLDEPEVKIRLNSSELEYEGRISENLRGFANMSEKDQAKSITTIRQSIKSIKKSYLKVRISSIRAVKPNLCARRSVIEGIKVRLEEVRFLYRISLTKRFQLYRRSRPAGSTLDYPFSDSPLDYKMLHLNPHQLLIQPEHFPRVTNTSGLPSRTPVQPRTSYPPPSSQKHSWINYKVIRSVSSSVDAPQSRTDKKRSAKSISPKRPITKDLTSLWEGTEYKIQLLASLYEKLMIKLVFELWQYSIYQEKLVILSDRNTIRLQQQFCKQLFFNGLKYYYLASQYIDQSSEKKAIKHFFFQKGKILFQIWKQQLLDRKYWLQQNLLPKAIKFHSRYHSITLFKQWNVFQFSQKKMAFYRRFASRYVQIACLVTVWRRWQHAFLSRHLLRMEMIDLYYPHEGKENQFSSQSVDLSLFENTNSLRIIRYLQRIECQHSRKELSSLYTSFRHRSFPRCMNFHVYPFTKEEQKDEKLLENYLQHQREKEFMQSVQTQILQSFQVAIQSKQILPQSRFTNHPEEEKVHLNHFNYGKSSQEKLLNRTYDHPTTPIYNSKKNGKSIYKSQLNVTFEKDYDPLTDRKKPLSYGEDDDSTIRNQGNSFSMPSPFSATKDSMKKLNFSTEFTDQLLNLSLVGSSSYPLSKQESIPRETRDHTARDVTKDEDLLVDLSASKRSMLWKYLQLKQMNRFVSSAFYFLRYLRCRIRLRQQFRYVTKYYYQQPLLTRSLHYWKYYYQRRQDYQMIITEQYTRRFLSIVLRQWQDYVYQKFHYRLQIIRKWYPQQQLRTHWKYWRQLFLERQQLQKYKQRYHYIVKKYHWKHWKGYISSLQSQRWKVLQIYRFIFYKKYFICWLEKYRKKTLLKRVFQQYTYQLYQQDHEQTSLPLQIKKNFQYLLLIFTAWKDYCLRQQQKRIEEKQWKRAFYYRGIHLYSKHFLQWKVYTLQRKQLYHWQYLRRIKQLRNIFIRWKVDYPRYLQDYTQQKQQFYQYQIHRYRFFKSWQRLCYQRWQHRQDVGMRIYQKQQQRILLTRWKQWSHFYGYQLLQRKSRSSRIKQQQFQLQRCWGLWRKLCWKHNRYRKGFLLLIKAYYNAKLRKAFYQFPSYQLKQRVEKFTKKVKKRKEKPPKQGFFSNVQLVDVSSSPNPSAKPIDEENIASIGVASKPHRAVKTIDDIHKEETGNDSFEEEKSIPLRIEEEKEKEDNKNEELDLSISEMPLMKTTMTKIVTTTNEKKLPVYTEADIQRLLSSRSLSTEIGERQITTDSELAKRLLSLNKDGTYSPRQYSPLPSPLTNPTTTNPTHTHEEPPKSFIKERKIILPIHERAFTYGYIASPNDFLALREILLLLKTILTYWQRYVQKERLLLYKYQQLVRFHRYYRLQRLWILWMRLTPKLAYRFVTWMRNRQYLT